ncbi:hypothetical protein ACHFCA_50890 (plasmid) [Delftia tsuruhatensis]
MDMLKENAPRTAIAVRLMHKAEREASLLLVERNGRLPMIRFILQEKTAGACLSLLPKLDCMNTKVAHPRRGPFMSKALCHPLLLNTNLNLN